jgi:hypothetical protein
LTSIARISRASVRASFPAITSRGSNGESAGTSRANFAFQGHTVCDVSRPYLVDLSAGRIRNDSRPEGEARPTGLCQTVADTGRRL